MSDYLKDSTDGQGFKNEFKSGLNAVYDAQFNPAKAPDADGFVARFLANTTKVGWQADRTLWQGSRITDIQDDSGATKLSGPDSEVGVVPIFGGISWTDNDITQIWYPSTAYHDEKGVLTGAYNFSDIAYAWGKMPVNERLDKAREGAKLFGETFGDGLQDGVAIAWQNIPYIKGGWAQWHVVDNAVMHFNVIDQGTGVYNAANGQLSDPNFFIVGDQISSLPGWQEGAIASRSEEHTSELQSH